MLFAHIIGFDTLISRYSSALFENIGSYSESANELSCSNVTLMLVDRLLAWLSA